MVDKTTRIEMRQNFYHAMARLADLEKQYVENDIRGAADITNAARALQGHYNRMVKELENDY